MEDLKIIVDDNANCGYILNTEISTETLSERIKEA
jgi:hypothetical protein